MSDASGRFKVLIVDDSPENIDILGGLLSNYQRLVATNGQKALDIAFSENRPDLILLDIVMPVMDGFEVCRRLKMNERTRHIPVIFITSKSHEEDEAKGLGLGAIDYIAKPFSPPIVRARVKNQMELIGARAALERQNQELIEAARFREDVERITRHDLKNPLSPVISFSQMLLTYDNLDERQVELLKIIKDSGYKMLSMINQSLDMFKMEKGMYPFEPGPVDMIRLVREIIVELDDLVVLKDLKVHLLMDGNPIREDDEFIVWAEELLSYSMLANLMKNAVEASPDAERIMVLFKTVNGELIRIHNMGAVPSDIRDRFFEKYVTSGKKCGIGLGAYSAKLIAETQNIGIEMTTSELTGTTVSLLW